MGDPVLWQEFLDACASGDERRIRESFEALYKETRRGMVRFAQSCVNGHSSDLIAVHRLDPEEVVQDAFCELYYRRPAVKKSLRAWFLGVIRNRILYEASCARVESKNGRAAQRELDRLRRLRMRRSPKTLRAVVRKAVDALPTRMRAVIIALYYWGESVQRTAELLRITVNAVIQARRRAIKKLGDLLR